MKSKQQNKNKKKRVVKGEKEESHAGADYENNFFLSFFPPR